MPVDFGMLLSASPPLYAYSAFADNRVSRFSPSSDFDETNSYDNGFPIPKQDYLNNHNFTSELGYSGFLPSLGRRSTYTINSDQTSSYGIKKECIGDSFEGLNQEDFHQNEILSNSQSCKQQKKKRVSFADDKGFELVEIRAIPLISNSTPKWAGNFLSLLTGSAKPTPICEKKWKPAFACPPYSTLALREQLEKKLVGLESVTVDEGEDDIISGTIKVKNTAFQKEVFVRVTYDRWASHIDIPALFLALSSWDEAGQVNTLYDSFRFSTVIPSSAFRYEVVEFCVCYRSNEKEHWDNNGGINYRLIATATGKELKYEKSVSKLQHNKKQINVDDNSTYTLSVTTFNDCPEFATWNHLINERPYW